MRLFALAMLLACAACSAETAGTAATSAAIKKQELDSGKRTLQRAEQKIGRSLELQQERTRSADPADR